MEQLDFMVRGFKFSGTCVGLKKNGRRDLGLIYSEVPCQVAGLFTTNTVKAAPVLVDMERIKAGIGQAVVVNSGNANACTGAQGLQDARKMCFLVAKQLGISSKMVFVCSTGVIGRPLPMDKIESGIPELVAALSPDGWMRTVEAIMTTDSFPKVDVATCTLRGKQVKLCGMIKGAGMIRPNVATMLSFLVTDANIKAPVLKKMLREAAEKSYNCITVDGEMSTNDTVLLLANGMSDHPQINRIDREAKKFQSMLSELCLNLAKSVVRDGEGATKFIEIRIKGARSQNDAKLAAYAIADSPLVKTAFYGEDPNWGRIISAVGHSGARFDPNRVDIYFDDLLLVKKGTGAGPQEEGRMREILKKKAIQVTVDLHQGKAGCSVFTTDLSIQYVKINASYTT